MRQAINENRALQLGLLGILALAAAFLLLGPKGSKSDESASAPPETTGTTGAAAVPAENQQAVQDAGSVSGVSSAGGVTVPAQLIPGPGLPKGLLSAYRHGDAIALLVRRAGGIDDALVRNSVERLRAIPGVEVYVTKARGIARYAWLTQGVDVTDLPALVVLRPRKLSKGTPTASVSYGFRDTASVLQALENALYRGPVDRPYHP